jgi:hypothetical protein
MTEPLKTRFHSAEYNEPKPIVNTFTPENRSRDSLIFRRIRKRIEEGYYESSQVLRDIAFRIIGTRGK